MAYKSFKINKDYTIAFEIFSKKMKDATAFERFGKMMEMGPVYKSGIRNWDSYDHYTYSVVMGLFRIMLYKDKHSLNSCN